MLEAKDLLSSKKKDPYPLYHHLKTAVKSGIESGSFPAGTMIPGEHRLTKMYNVSRTTVVKAISELVNEGVLYRITGKGTFVSPPSKTIKPKSIVGIVMPASGHIFGELASSIIRCLEDHDNHCVVVNFNGQNTSKIKSLIRTNPGALVIDAMYEFPIKLLETYSGQIIFINRYSHKERINASYYLSDFYQAGRIAADYFLSSGFEKILMATYKPFPGAAVLNNKIAGIKSALKAKDLPADNLVRVNWDKIDEIKAALNEAEKPAAVFADGDSRAKNVYRAAAELGLRLPEDVSVLGCNNTPWCDMLDPALSSLDMQEIKMAELAADEIIGGRKAFKKMYLKPQIVERESTRRGNYFQPTGGNAQTPGGDLL